MKASKEIGLLISSVVVLALACSAQPVQAAGEKRALAENGANPWVILVRQDALDLDKTAANELAKYLKQVTGADFKVQAATPPLPEKAILVGPVELQAPADLGEDGFVIQTVGNHLNIVGGASRGAIYGVY
jgi:hypothetical protein